MDSSTPNGSIAGGVFPQLGNYVLSLLAHHCRNVRTADARFSDLTFVGVRDRCVLHPGSSFVRRRAVRQEALAEKAVYLFV